MTRIYQVETEAHRLQRGDMISKLPASAGGDIQELEGILGQDALVVTDIEISLSAKFLTVNLRSVEGSAQGQEWTITLPSRSEVVVGRLA